MQAQVVQHVRGMYTVIEVPSTSNPDKMYRVDVTNQRCSCPAWTFKRGGRSLCKHLRGLGFTELAQTQKVSEGQLQNELFSPVFIDMDGVEVL